jgi:uncharacterized membrane protein YgdD (TMEM256/DUF423 family)
MDFDKSIDNATRYIFAHPLVGVALAAAVIALIYLRPKAVFKFAVAAAIIGAVLYVGMFLVSLTSTGIQEQDKLLDTPVINNTKDQ